MKQDETIYVRLLDTSKSLKIGRRLSLKKYVLLIFILLMVVTWYWLPAERVVGFTYRRNISCNSPLEHNIRGFLISGSGCRLPDLDPYDPCIQDALNEKIDIDCGKVNFEALVKSTARSLYIDYEAVKRNKSNPAHFDCCYRPYERIGVAGEGPYESLKDAPYVYSNDCYIFKNGWAEVTEHENVRVECHDGGKLVYKDFYFFVKNMTRAEAKDITPEKNLSVLVIGMDTVSRLNFQRQLMSTHNFLTKELNALEFFGYHKVAENTFPNAVPLLMGQSEEEITKTCWPTHQSRFDNCHFIWQDFKKIGYTTGFAEDAYPGGIFEYCKYGFRSKPTEIDVHMRVFLQAYRTELSHFTDICIGSKLNVEIILDAVLKFVTTLYGKLSFGFFWENGILHDSFNAPKSVDTMHLELYKKLHQTGIFNKSFVVFVSDHGYRWGKIRSTYQGFIENRLPSLIISCPDWFKTKYPLAYSNLKTNTRGLTTPFDVHETLKDLTDLNLLEDASITNRTQALNKKLPRGISLFLPIPSQRTCDDAGINSHWCVCQQYDPIMTTHPNVASASNFILNHINSMLENYASCWRLKIKSILSASLKIPYSDPANDTNYDRELMSFDNNFKYYTVKFITYPGDAIFESTVKHHVKLNAFDIIGTISRLDTYGTTSQCVADYYLRLFCYCKDN